MTQVKLLYSDRAGRYKSGEVGTILLNNSDKYDYLISLVPCTSQFDSFFSKKGQLILRNFYFYKEELELINENIPKK